MEKFRIVTDSSSDLLTLDKVPFCSAPFKIVTARNEYTDDKKINVAELINDLYTTKERTSTSCPNTGDWLSAFGGARHVFCVTVTSAISGSYNAACLAKEMYEKENPGHKVYVIDSLSAGPELKLIAEKLDKMIASGMDFDSICIAIEEYKKSTGLLFILESLKNLVNNGRAKPIVAKAAGILGIRILGRASDGGELQLLNKCRGQDKAMNELVAVLKGTGLNTGRVCIAHCDNESAAKKLKGIIHKEISKAKVEIYKCRGLCSFYAEKGGLLIGFEKF